MPEMNYGVVDTRAGSGINGGIGTAPTGEHRGEEIEFAHLLDPEGNTFGIWRSLG